MEKLKAKTIRLSMFIALLLIPTILAGSVIAQAVEVYFEPSTIQVEPGQQFEVNIMVNPHGYGISACEINISYDQDAFTLINAQIGDLLGDDPVVGLEDIESPGTILYAIARRGSTTPPTPTGTLLTLTFQVNSEAQSGSKNIEVVSVALVDENFQSIANVATSSLTVEVSTPAPSGGEGGGCLIATAAFGSELAGPVQFLRSFRDEDVLKTVGGQRFMEVFNAWYYSWSPYVASAERGNELLRNTVKAMLYPLIGDLIVARQVYGILSFNSELAVIMAGITAGILIGLTYSWPLIAAAALTGGRLRLPIKIKWLIEVLLAAVIIHLTSLYAFTAALYITGPFIVLASLALGGALTKKLLTP